MCVYCITNYDVMQQTYIPVYISPPVHLIDRQGDCFPLWVTGWVSLLLDGQLIAVSVVNSKQGSHEGQDRVQVKGSSFL